MKNNNTLLWASCHVNVYRRNLVSLNRISGHTLNAHKSSQMNAFVHTFKDVKRSITSSPRLLSFVLFLNPTHVFSNIASSACTRTTSYAHIHGEKWKIHMHTHTGTQKDLLMWLPGMSLWTASLWVSASYDYLTSSASLRCTHTQEHTQRCKDTQTGHHPVVHQSGNMTCNRTDLCTSVCEVTP